MTFEVIFFFHLFTRDIAMNDKIIVLLFSNFHQTCIEIAFFFSNDRGGIPRIKLIFKGFATERKKNVFKP